MIVVRHGLMLVGPTGGGKSSNLHILEETLGSLKKQGIHGFAYEFVRIMQLNPKSITMGQMYGKWHVHYFIIFLTAIPVIYFIILLVFLLFVTAII
jgi:hypothetical protein